ncbi:MAG: penicillin-binding protein 1A [Hyphomicrobiales bacterium]|nr:penicillin-binding protein 1A [Hyphomicrobiales bacterium]MBV9054226.1 penicillin-binding protein 1A [Hyphomicrobiales bacterium]
MRSLIRFLGFLFATATVVFVVGAGAAAFLIWHYSQDLPDYTQLRDYEPPVMTRVHAADGSLIAEYAKERRLYLPVQDVPKLVIDAFISAEDKNFFNHSGVDPEGITRAIIANFTRQGRRQQGASTITQQVAKNFLLSSEQTYDRKIKEMLLALRIEATYTKEKILELYLNQIYLGFGNYGIAAAALNYYGKSVHELTLGEAAYLAALPKAPSNYNPFERHDAAVERRNWVLDRMAENGFATRADVEKAKAEDIHLNLRNVSPNNVAAGFFTEEVRRELADRYGSTQLYEGGLSVRTTLDPALQLIARKALVDGLVRYDESHGWHGVIQKVDLGRDWGEALAQVPALTDVKPWQLAVVLDANDLSAKIGLQPARLASGAVSPQRETGTITSDNVRWSRKGRLREVLSDGDVVYVEPLDGKPGQYRLRQIPEISGGLVAMDPWTGRVFAMVGGFSFSQSEFNRATQALRQPGSAFKPFVYATALDNGYTPSTVIVDGPIEIDQGPGLPPWRPENFEPTFAGPKPMRYGLEHSKNLMTVRLAKDIGMPLIVEYAKKFGIYDDLKAYLPMSLGAGETTVLRLTTAYSMLANGGRRIKPTLIDRIQDRWGHTIFKHDERICSACDADDWHDQPEPKLIDKREQVIDPMTAYQITSMMQGVIQRGTGVAIRALGRTYIAGKTGTTNEAKDLWFVGFTANLAMGVYIGFDQPRSLGEGENAQAATYAAPIFRDFMGMALKDKPDTPFRVPEGIKLIRVSVATGLRANASDTNTVMEAFKPGQAPPDFFAGGGGGTRSAGVSPEADRAVGAGTGGLY